MKTARAKLKAWSAASTFTTKPATFAAADREAIPAILAGLMFAHADATLLVVAPDSHHADQLARAVQSWAKLIDDPRRIRQVPEIRGLRREWVPENEASRCAALDAALSGQPAIFVADVASLLSSCIPPTAFRQTTFSLAVGQKIPPREIVEHLLELDYDNEVQVDLPGEFSLRGGILDIYSPLCEAPVRVDFFGDEIESMRLFDPESQRSFATVDNLRIVPRGRAVFSDEETIEGDYSLLDYFPRQPVIVRCTVGDIDEHLQRFGDPTALASWHKLCLSRGDEVVDIRLPGESVVQNDDGRARRPIHSPVCLGLSESRLPTLPELGPEALTLHWQLLRDNLLAWHATGWDIVACCGSEGEATRFEEMLQTDEKAQALGLAIRPLPLPGGVQFPNHKLVFLSERELFGKRSSAPRQSRRRYLTEHWHDDEGASLEDGCLAVHATHGICRFHGIKTIEVAGGLQEVMELEFAERAKLFVPLDQSALVTRYVGGVKKIPALSKIGGTAWKNNKLSALASAEDLAAELLRLEAMRQHAAGVAFDQPSDWERDFAASFPYRETEDQSKAIAEVLDDMADTRPMDRLLCGDVGYGKTEVAIRAAFRAVMHGRQVAVLVPTTILAQQHHATFSDRMAEYPVIVESLSRFKSAGEQSRLLEQLALGRIDIVIGTHRLLQKDVDFANLGLVVIDEEQRFGVKHKERLKQLRASVDILTMTATPIPRTLYFSLAGLRNLSTITTPPAERLPVKTVVAQYDKRLIGDAITRELARNGQVFALHNRVRTIEAFCRELSRMAPDARFAIAHGQMPPHELESVMTAYVAGDVDVLVCTTIIESGLDIPNANTIIIDHAERFGLAELYQLRGRVGRYHNQAYAYLLLPPMGGLPRNARERIVAVRQYTHLGAGFKLALRDLEIRGAGNILGQEQSGQIAAVGFELYCELLRDAVARLENQPTQAEKRARVSIDTIAYGIGAAAGRQPAAIPPDYIEAEAIRVECYRRLQAMHTEAAIDPFAAELRDRFGPPPTAVENLLEINRIRALAEERGLREVSVVDRRVLLKAEGKTLAAPEGRLPRLLATTPTEQLRELANLIRRVPTGG